METTNMGKGKSKEQRSRKKFPLECLNKMGQRENRKNKLSKIIPLANF